MGNGSSHAHGGGAVPIQRQPAHWHHSLPSDPVLKASHLKVLPDLDQGARLRSTNNGAILQSGGTISGGKRPLSLALPHDRDHHTSNGVFRSKSISQDYEAEKQPRFSYLSNQRDPLHRSHTHLHIEDHDDSFATQSKRFGSEPDLRNSQEIQTKTNKIARHMKKKYKAPPPPHISNEQGGSSPDSWNAQQSYEPPQVPSRKLRLFKTRAETKKSHKHNHEIKMNGYVHSIPPVTKTYELEDLKPYPNDIFESSRFVEREKVLRSPSRDRDEYLKYPSSREEDMIQTQMSLKREENILQTAFSKQEQLRSKYSQQNMYREKARAKEDKFDSNKAFRNSERFKKQGNENSNVLRREKSFDNSLMQEINGVSRLHMDRQMLLEDQMKFNGRGESPVEVRLKDRLDEVNVNKKTVSAIPNGMASAEFQAELMMATRKLRSVNRTSPDSNLDVKKDKKTPITKPEPKINSNKERQDKRVTKEPAVKNNMVTLDRTKQIKPKDGLPRVVHKQKKDDKIVHTQKKEEVKTAPKVNGTKVLPTKTNLENLRNRRDSRAIGDRGQASGKESSPEQSPTRNKLEEQWDKNQQNHPNKSFYFGMDKNVTPKPAVEEEEEEEMDAHEKVRRHLEMNYKNMQNSKPYHEEPLPVTKKNIKNEYNTRIELPPGSPESALSSEADIEDNPHGIALQLRPTLPKKQLEIPRFSPAAAWRLLAALETETEASNNNTNNEDNASPAEERIRRSSRGALLSAPRPPRSHDKSGDSGISGDAGPPNDDIGTPTTPSSPVRKEDSSKRPLLSAWTPQQDLEEESSSDAGVDSPHSANTDSAPAKFSARQQVFSLSLPRETHLNQLGDKNKQLQQPFNSLQKLRKSVSGALGVALGAKKPELEIEENSADEQPDNNWFLSRSAPNSLNNGLNAPNLKLSTAKSHDSGQHQTPPSSDQEDETLPPVMPCIMRPQPPFSYLATGGHVMYLPQYDSQRTTRTNMQSANPSQDQPYSISYDKDVQPDDKLKQKNEKQKSDGEMEENEIDNKDKYAQYRMMRSKSSGELITNRGASSKPRSKGKRFTFQSTVRQIERRRLAEKLSKEAETKEKQRLSELEAMRRVEEEFQRKRAREKASIRQQLRLVSLDESCSSLPNSWGAQGRSEPEGAVSSSPSGTNGAHPRRSRNSDASNSSIEGQGGSTNSNQGARAPATRVLSEYRQDTREYRDYRRTPAAPALHPHPPACYNMPRAPHTAHRTGGWSETANDSDNYRREFARGRRAPSSSGSDLSQGGRLLTPPRW